MYYKITTQDMRSINLHLPQEFIIKYKIGDRIRSKKENAPLAVFDSLKEVEIFRLSNWDKSNRIFECSIIKSQKKWPCVPIFYIKRHMHGEDNIPDLAWPSGTVLADEVTLIKEITDKDKEPEIFYKIVDMNMRSINAGLGIGVTYEKNEWILPKFKEAPLMVFNNLGDARYFQYGLGISKESKIFKCEILKSKRKWIYCEDYTDFTEVLKSKRYRKKPRLSGGRHILFPIGTVFADAVKLIDNAL